MENFIVIDLKLHVVIIPPGNANTTTRFPLNKSAVDTSFHLNGFGPGRVSSLTLALKTTLGTRSPSFKDIDKDLLNIEAPALVTGLNAIADANKDKITANWNIFLQERCNRSQRIQSK
jgi:hypothetical protein